MERDTIERLAIDSAAGELSDDARTLFEAYLAEHRQANEWAQDMLGVYEETEAAIASKTNRARAETRAKPAHVFPLARVRSRLIVRWAAVVVAAFGIGAGFGRLSKQPAIGSRPRATSAKVDPYVRQWGRSLEGVGDSFWRAKAIASLAPKRHLAAQPHKSGASLWSKYRQYVKERRYE
ncbi:MAG: hypothetical protein JSU70_01580 [Phycisphaerales bacterium]|nr:MAG: hypothetical protein JSV36_03555 [Anaerolineae bacterium]UCG58199.1 MAG: hypothetical protein JSU70_01580 [Phycisphaerales bacterium]